MSGGLRDVDGGLMQIFAPSSVTTISDTDTMDGGTNGKIIMFPSVEATIKVNSDTTTFPLEAGSLIAINKGVTFTFSGGLSSAVCVVMS